MPCIFRDGKVGVYIYADDHAPPHFHIRSPDSNAQIEIATLQVMRGTVLRNEFKRVITWAEENWPLILEKWRELNERD